VIGCEDRLRNDLYCVEWGVKLYSIHPSIQCDDYPSYRASLPLTDTKLCCLVMDTDDQVTLGCYLKAERPGMELAIFLSCESSALIIAPPGHTVNFALCECVCTSVIAAKVNIRKRTGSSWRWCMIDKNYPLEFIVKFLMCMSGVWTSVDKLYPSVQLTA